MRICVNSRFGGVFYKSLNWTNSEFKFFRDLGPPRDVAVNLDLPTDLVVLRFKPVHRIVWDCYGYRPELHFIALAGWEDRKEFKRFVFGVSVSAVPFDGRLDTSDLDFQTLELVRVSDNLSCDIDRFPRTDGGGAQGNFDLWIEQSQYRVANAQQQ